MTGIYELPHRALAYELGRNNQKLGALLQEEAHLRTILSAIPDRGQPPSALLRRRIVALQDQIEHAEETIWALGLAGRGMGGDVPQTSEPESQQKPRLRLRKHESLS